VATTYLEVSKRPFSSAERHTWDGGSARLQPPPVVLGGLTVGQSAQSGHETEFKCRRAEGFVKVKVSDGAETVKVSCLRRRVVSVGV
jgi:hypothetical protein